LKIDVSLLQSVATRVARHVASRNVEVPKVDQDQPTQSAANHDPESGKSYKNLSKPSEILKFEILKFLKFLNQF
jgi:hypothetical protein